jgi:hypothetical protein
VRGAAGNRRPYRDRIENLATRHSPHHFARETWTGNLDTDQFCDIICAVFCAQFCKQ